jgi:hypothetical protein
MKRHLKLKLNDNLQIIETYVMDANTGKLIESKMADRMDKDRQGRLKTLIESSYIEFESNGK